LLPKIDTMIDRGVVKAGDIIVAKGWKDEEILLKNGNVWPMAKQTLFYKIH